jgi:hypothetical protein
MDQTKVMDGTLVRVMSWYDNEVGLLQPHGRHRRRDGQADLILPCPAGAARSRLRPLTRDRILVCSVARSRFARAPAQVADGEFRTTPHARSSWKQARLLRVDLNVPMENGKVTDATRIERVAPTITEIATRAARSSCSPISAAEGPDEESLNRSPPPVAQRRTAVAFAEDCIGDEGRGRGRGDEAGDICCLENTRFHKGEEKNDPASSPSSPSSATSGSTTRSRPRTARTPRPKASATSCRPMPAAPCRPSSRRSTRRWKRRRSR